MTQVAGKGGGEGDGEGTKEVMDVGVGRGPEGLLHCRLGMGVRLGCLHLAPGPRLPEDSLCTHSPSVQFLESSRVPLQSRPPFWGGGAMHSRLRQWAHSVLQADHLLHSVHAPSTAGAQHMARGNTHAGTRTVMCTGHAEKRMPHAQPHTNAQSGRQVGREPQ